METRAAEPSVDKKKQEFCIQILDEIDRLCLPVSTFALSTHVLLVTKFENKMHEDVDKIIFTIWPSFDALWKNIR